MNADPLYVQIRPLDGHLKRGLILAPSFSVVPAVAPETAPTLLAIGADIGRLGLGECDVELVDCGDTVELTFHEPNDAFAFMLGTKLKVLSAERRQVMLDEIEREYREFIGLMDAFKLASILREDDQ